MTPFQAVFMGARKYNPIIRKYCEANGIDKPPAFDRHTASRYAVVRIDVSPPRLSAKTFFKKEDLHYYIKSVMKDLGLTDGGALPLCVLDFGDQIFLTIETDGRTRSGSSFAG
jgi:hypothetical protein